MEFIPIMPQNIPNIEAVVHWGVHFVHENVVRDYGPGEAAKAEAEKTVESWSTSPYPLVLVSQVILPWSRDENLVIPLAQAIREARSEPSAVVALRYWLVENGYETETDRKTGLATQVPLVKKMRKSAGITQALEHLNVWLGTNGYVSK